RSKEREEVSLKELRRVFAQDEDDANHRGDELEGGGDPGDALVGPAEDLVRPRLPGAPDDRPRPADRRPSHGEAHHRTEEDAEEEDTASKLLMRQALVPP